MEHFTEDSQLSPLAQTQFAHTMQMVKSVAPTVRMHFYKHGSSSLIGFSKPGGFRDLGLALTLGYIQYGEASDFLNLIAKVEADARSLGFRGLWGPLDFSTYFGYRLRLNHFHRPAFPGEPSNGSREVELFTQAGFRAEKLYRSHWIPVDKSFIRWIRTMSMMSRGLSARSEFALETLSDARLTPYAEDFYRLTHDLFKDHFAYEDIGSELFKNEILRRLEPVVCTRTSLLVKDPQGQLIGYGLNLRNPYNPKEVLLKTLAVSGSSATRSQIFFAIMQRMFELGVGHYDQSVICLVAEGTSSDRFAQKVKVDTAEYGLFYKEL